MIEFVLRIGRPSENWSIWHEAPESLAIIRFTITLLMTVLVLDRFADVSSAKHHWESTDKEPVIVVTLFFVDSLQDACAVTAFEASMITWVISVKFSFTDPFNSGNGILMFKRLLVITVWVTIYNPDNVSTASVVGKNAPAIKEIW